MHERGERERGTGNLGPLLIRVETVLIQLRSSVQPLGLITTMTVRLLTPFLVVIPAILFGLYQIRLKPFLEVGGVWKEVQDVGRELKDTCTRVDELKGCERKCIFWLLELELELILVISSRWLFREQTP